MSDRELLEAAARAAGLRVNFHPAASYVWNPLTDDGDALRLMVRLNISVLVATEHDPGKVFASDGRVGVIEPHGEEVLAATRRAIVRAAAAMAEGGA